MNACLSAGSAHGTWPGGRGFCTLGVGLEALGTLTLPARSLPLGLVGRLGTYSTMILPPKATYEAFKYVQQALRLGARPLGFRHHIPNWARRDACRQVLTNRSRAAASLA